MPSILTVLLIPMVVFSALANILLGTDSKRIIEISSQMDIIYIFPEDTRF